MAISEDLILCIDIGGTCIKASQFFCAPDGNLVLEKFAYLEYSVESEDANTDAMIDALVEVITANSFDAKNTYVSVSGQSSFTRFIKVPAVSTDKNKSKELIAFEARQTIPFPMDEVVWDSQVIPNDGQEEGAEFDALLAIVKNEVVNPIVDCIEGLGNDVKNVEVSAISTYNAARANNVGNEQCEMILNIGGKYSSLIFVDGNKIFVRSIPIAGVTITQQIAKEFNIPFEEAEEMKRRHGFVALGGAYEEPESEVAATVSKIVRNVMTRLHAEINRSINIYRASQHGRKPEKLYLSGGSSILAFTPRFFSEKLRVPVEYFNPFQVVTLGEDIDKDMLRDVAHLFSEMVGLSLRHIGNPPIAISLIPEAARKQQIFKLKRPFFYAACVALLVYLCTAYWAFSNQSRDIEEKYVSIQRILDAKRKTNRSVQTANTNFQQQQDAYNKIVDMLQYRENWIDFFDQFQTLIPDNIWFSRISLDTKPKVEGAAGAAAQTTADSSMMDDMGGYDDGSGMFGRGRSRGFSFDAVPQEQPKQETKISAVQWLNMEAFIFCEKGNYDKLPETNHAIGIFTDMLRSSGLFVDANPNFKQDVAIYRYNITEFRYSIELKKPINSIEFTKILRDKERLGKMSAIKKD